MGKASSHSTCAVDRTAPLTGNFSSYLGLLVSNSAELLSQLAWGDDAEHLTELTGSSAWVPKKPKPSDLCCVWLKQRQLLFLMLLSLLYILVCRLDPWRCATNASNEALSSLVSNIIKTEPTLMFSMIIMRLSLIAKAHTKLHCRMKLNDGMFLQNSALDWETLASTFFERRLWTHICKDEPSSD